ncbi:hypothetical protein [Dyadobacter sp.]|uniref:hypothetical protein n=1 Tax=Dyadobacter sp. TaxID=1914288 RepID=UPI003F6E9D72
MKLVQKLPIALSLACMMILASCSKEEGQVLTASDVEGESSHSNLKENMLPWIAPTKGYPGYNVLPNLWERYSSSSSASDPTAFPVGISNPINLWGSTSSPFKQPLQAIPNQPWSSFVTLTTSSKTDLKKKSIVDTQIRFLTPGKTYQLTVYVSTAIPKWKGIGPIPTYAERCELWIAGPSVGMKTYSVNFTNKTNVWIKKVIVFEAKTPEMTFAASALPVKEGEHAWAHVFVGQDAIKQLD